MGLFNDVRFYLMAALAILFLLVVAMCSSAYDSSADGHDKNAGVVQESTEENSGHADAAKDTEEHSDAAPTEQADTQSLVATTESTATETAAVVETAEVEEVAVEEVAVEEAVTEEAATEEVAVESTATETTEETTTATAAVSEPVAVEEAPTFELGSQFEISPLSETGDTLTDFGTDLGNLKSDMGKFTDRLQNAE